MIHKTWFCICAQNLGLSQKITLCLSSRHWCCVCKFPSYHDELHWKWNYSPIFEKKRCRNSHPRGSTTVKYPVVGLLFTAKWFCGRKLVSIIIGIPCISSILSSQSLMKVCFRDSDLKKIALASILQEIPFLPSKKQTGPNSPGPLITDDSSVNFHDKFFLHFLLKFSRKLRNTLHGNLWMGCL